MNQFLSYIPAKSPIHNLDARIKLIVLLVFSITVFCIHTPLGLGFFALMLFAVMALSRVGATYYAKTLLPALAILLFIWLCNSIPFELERSLNALLYVVRIALVILASFVVTFTTTSTSLTSALSSLLNPLRKLHVPVDDIALTLSLALRFIPLLFEKLTTIKNAQLSRGAAFNNGSLWNRLKSWLVVFIPLFVGFFRQADTVAEAMDARCYGASKRTNLNARAVSYSGWITLGVTCLVCVVCVAVGL